MWKPILGVLLVASVGAWLLLKGEAFGAPGRRHGADAAPHASSARPAPAR